MAYKYILHIQQKCNKVLMYLKITTSHECRPKQMLYINVRQWADKSQEAQWTDVVQNQMIKQKHFGPGKQCWHLLRRKGSPKADYTGRQCTSQ